MRLNTQYVYRGNPMNMMQFPSEVVQALGCYVYVYSDPRDGAPFYIGKGIGNRVFSHLTEELESDKVAKIRAIRDAGQEPMIEILRHGLTDDQAALIEASAIDLLGLESLTNKCRGLHARSLGRVSVPDVTLSYSAEPTDCTDAMMLITINKLYRSGMPAQELYEATRGVWKVGKRRDRARYAAAVFQGIIREVFTIDRWQRAGTDSYQFRDDSQFAASKRWEFCGATAPPDIQDRYNRKSVKHLLGTSAQNPIRYVNC